MSEETSERRHGRKIVALIAVATVAAAGWYIFLRPDSAANQVETHRVERGDLPVRIVTGGNAESLTPRHIKIQVRERNVQLLELIEEGRRITAEDVRRGLVLARLDTTDIEEEILEEEVDYEQAYAGFNRAQQELEIMAKENESRLQQARRAVRFSAMDLRKYLGEEMANAMMQRVNRQRKVEAALEDFQNAMLRREETHIAAETAIARVRDQGDGDNKVDELMAAVDTGASMTSRSSMSSKMVQGLAERYGLSEREQSIEELAAEAVIASQAAELAAARVKETQSAFFSEAEAMNFNLSEFEGDPKNWSVEFEAINYDTLSLDPRLGGEAALRREELQTNLMLDRESLLMSKKSLEGSEELFANEFIPETELEKERLTFDRMRTELDLKSEDERIFFTYDFPKAAEQAVANYEDALRNLARVQRTTETRMLRAKVEFLESQMRLFYRQRSRNWHREQYGMYTIRAEQEGLIVYGEAGNQNQDWDEQIREGMDVRQGMILFTIPDPNDMAFEVRLHESEIQHVAVGQLASIRVEAHPEVPLRGIVERVDILPSSRASYYNPEMRIYNAMIKVTDEVDWLRPGMTAEIELGISELQDVIMVPLEAVTTRGGDSVCYLPSGAQRVIQPGLFNERFIEVRQGLEEGEEVVLNPRWMLNDVDDGSGNVSLWMPKSSDSEETPTQTETQDGA